MTPVNLDLLDYEIRFVFPKLHISTFDAYANVVPNTSCVDLLELPNIPVEFWKESLVNDFEYYIFTKYPELQVIKNNFYSQGAIYASMTGSGSVVYGVFEKSRR